MSLLWCEKINIFNYELVLKEFILVRNLMVHIVSPIIAEKYSNIIYSLE